MAKNILPAEYKYVAIPKIDPKAYLVASIRNWTTLNLLDGEASIFIDNKYTGKSLIYSAEVKDTMEWSLGPDHNIIVKREKDLNKTSKKRLSNTTRHLFSFSLEVVNTRSGPVSLEIFDQIPVSNTDRIEVRDLDLSGGELNDKTGIIRWVVKLDPGKKRKWNLDYEVRYPADEFIVLE